MPSTTILVDGNSVGYAEHYATKLRSGELETQAIYGYIRRMRDMREGYPGCKVTVLWDGRAQWRYDLCPTYKSNRESDPKKIAIKKAYQEQKPYIARALACIGVTQTTCVTHEADDLGGYFSKALVERDPENKVILYTGDHDWFQLVRPGVVLRDARDPSFYLTDRDFAAKTGYATPLAFLEGKALQGDTSDVIPGVGGIGEKGAKEFLDRWGSVRNFYHDVDTDNYVPQARRDPNAKTLHPEQLLASREGRQAFQRNLKLMQLLRVAQPKPEDMRTIRSAPDKEKFAELCEELNFVSYLRDLDNFFKPFES